MTRLVPGVDRTGADRVYNPQPRWITLGGSLIALHAIELILVADDGLHGTVYLSRGGQVNYEGELLKQLLAAFDVVIETGEVGTIGVAPEPVNAGHGD
jgi:hypothetical protein